MYVKHIAISGEFAMKFLDSNAKVETDNYL